MPTKLMLIVLLLGTVPAHAQDNRAQVLMLGVFHFANPGLDTVKTAQIDVMTPENQAYLEALSLRLAGFAPTHVLVEAPREREATLQAEYQDYLAGNLALPANETYQLGFRVARAAALAGVTPFDERSVGWDTAALFTYMEQSDAQALARVNAAIAEVTTLLDTAHHTRGFNELLRMYNSEDMDRMNHDLYLLTNEVAAGDGYHGATATSSWWERNFRMYANVQQAAQPGTRLLVIAGQGHTAIMKQFLASDSRRVAVSVGPFLEE